MKNLQYIRRLSSMHIIDLLDKDKFDTSANLLTTHWWSKSLATVWEISTVTIAKTSNISRTKYTKYYQYKTDSKSATLSDQQHHYPNSSKSNCNTKIELLPQVLKQEKSSIKFIMTSTFSNNFIFHLFECI